MRAGKLVRPITIERSATTINAAGTPVPTWAAVATLLAEVVDQSTEEFLRGGATDETAAVFRTRHFDGVTTADRLLFDGQAFNIRAVVPIGRRKGLEIRCVAQGAG